MRHVVLNGELMRRELAKIPVTDQLIVSGEALRLSFRVDNCVALQLEKHIDRLAAALSSPQIALPYAVSERMLARDVATLCARDQLYDAMAHYIVTPGEDTPLLTDLRHPPKATTLLYLEPLDEYRALADKGLRLWISPFRRARGDVAAAFPGGGNVRQATRMAVREGYDDAVLTDEAGNLLNACCGNLFVVSGGALITPHLQKDGVYPGVTRELVISEAAKLGLVVYQEKLTPEVCARAEEIFVTSSALELAFVREIGGRKFSEFPLSAKLLLSVRERLQKEKSAQ